MTIPTDKPLKTCKFCGKEVYNLSTHIINNHLSVVEQLEEKSLNLTSSPEILEKSPLTQLKPASDLNQMLKDKIETMMNIKIMQMLEKGATLEEVNRAINPPPAPAPLGLKELKEFHDIFYKNNVAAAPVESGANWADVLLAAAPVIMEMLPKKKNKISEGVKNDEFRTDESGSIRVLKSIQEETPGDTDKPGSTSEKPGDTSKTE